MGGEIQFIFKRELETFFFIFDQEIQQIARFLEQEHPHSIQCSLSVLHKVPTKSLPAPTKPSSQRKLTCKADCSTLDSSDSKSALPHLPTPSIGSVSPVVSFIEQVYISSEHILQITIYRLFTD
jgi:hypothetical protein